MYSLLIILISIHSFIEKLYKHQMKCIFQIEPWIFQTYCR